jgi:hypothetical protein
MPAAAGGSGRTPPTPPGPPAALSPPSLSRTALGGAMRGLS